MSTDTLRIVVIGYVWPEPNSSAAGQNMLSLIKAFTDNHHKVTFMTAAADSIHKEDLDNLNVTSEAIALNCSSVNARLAEIAPDVVVFDRYMSEEQFSWRVKEVCPEAIRILNTEDLHSLRQARHEAVKAHGDARQATYSTTLAQREVAAILRSDLTLIISRAEYALLTDYYRVPAQQLCYHPLPISLFSKPLVPFEARSDIVTIGNFRHAPNWDSVLQLKQHIWPAIKKALPSANLHIYGAYPPKKATQLHNPTSGFYLDGWAQDAKQVIANAKLLIAPLRFGAGVKGKLLDAMSCGTPTLTTWIGAEGIVTLSSPSLPAHQPNQAQLSMQLNQDQWGGAICSTTSEFVDHAKRLYEDPQEWGAASTQSIHVFNSYQQDTQDTPLISRILSIYRTLHEHRGSLFLQALLWHQTLNASKYMSQWIEAKNRPQSSE